MTVEYIHYGHKKFQINRFDPIRNEEFRNKPFGGLWASRTDARYGWKDWNEDEQFRKCEEENSFRFTLSTSANVLEIHSHKDLDKISQVKKSLFNGSCLPDFEELLFGGVDAIELFLSDDRELYWSLYGWDCDSILIMNPNVVEEIF